MRSRLRPIAPALLPIALMAGQAGAQDRPAAPPEINKPFEDPDVSRSVERFERESREVYARREAIVRAIGLRPGMAVADVGAGTGLFTRMFAERVGAEGLVYAVDISRPFLKHIADEASRRGQSQVKTILGSQDSTNLPQNSIDVAFLSDTYHHLEHPAKVLASIHRALRPGGRLVVVEFDRREGSSSAFVLEHVRAGQDVFRAEIEAAGFEPVATENPPKLSENFFAAFRKIERPAGPDQNK